MLPKLIKLYKILYFFSIDKSSSVDKGWKKYMLFDEWTLYTQWMNAIEILFSEWIDTKGIKMK